MTYFRIFASSILLIVLYLLSKRLGRSFPRRKWLINILLSLAILPMVAFQVIYRESPFSVSERWFRDLATFGSWGMGLFATFMMYLLVAEIFYWLITKFIPQKNETNAQRREWFQKWLPMGILGASAGTSFKGSFDGETGPEVKKVEIKVPGLHHDLDGFTIAQISDLHVGPNIYKEYVSKVVDMTNELNVDMIALTGDMADGFPTNLAEHIAPLGELKAKHGVFYTTGNHEYYWDGPLWIEAFKNFKHETLINENRVISVNGSKLLIGGVPDLHAPRFIKEHVPNYQKAGQTFEDVDFKILLAHRPDVYKEAHAAGFNLQLSGHTHSGQFFPWSLLVHMVYKMSAGLNRFENLWVYVNGATGYWGTANRFLIPSEITLITLCKEVESEK